VIIQLRSTDIGREDRFNAGDVDKMTDLWFD